MKMTSRNFLPARILGLLLVLTSLFFLCNTLTLKAQGPFLVDLDPSFDRGGAESGFGGAESVGGVKINAIVVDSSGNILVGGDFTNYKGQPANYIIRLKPNGDIDPAFNTGGAEGGFNDDVRSIVLDKSGNILVGGSFSIYNGQFNNGIVRLKPNGDIDPLFNTGVVTGFVRTVAIDSNGNILVGGALGNLNIIRLKPNGDFDPSFNPGNHDDDISSVTIKTIALDSNGKILLGGLINEYTENQPSYNIIRLESNGIVDPSFNSGGTSGGFDNEVSTVTLDSSGKILVIGFFTSYKGQSAKGIIRLKPNGDVDSSLNLGSGFNKSVSSIALDNNGNILVGGSFSTYKGQPANHIIRLKANGDMDSSFNSGGATGGLGSSVDTIALDSSGKILVGGHFSTSNGQADAIIRLKSNGDIDPSFTSGGPASGFDGIVFTLALDNDGNLLVGGEFENYKGQPIPNGIIRLRPNGDIDSSFNIGQASGSFDTGGVSTIILDNDGNILVGGKFETYKGQPAHNIIRLKPNGDIDSSFDTGKGFDANEIKAIALDGNGNILVGGDFTTYKGQPAEKIIRLKPNGDIDPSFHSGGANPGFDNNVYTIVLDSSGNIFVGGLFTTYNGMPANHIIKLKPNGNIDSSFNSGGANGGFDGGEVDIISLEGSENILVGGTFSTYKGQSANEIIRLKPNGDIDPSFNSGGANGGFNTGVYSIFRDSSDNILVGGAFTKYNGQPANRIIRLKPNGDIDSSVSFGSGFNGPVDPTDPDINGPINSIVLDSSGNIFIGGAFTSYKEQAANRIAKLLLVSPTPPPDQQATVSIVGQGHKFVLSRNGGQLSEELPVIISFKTRSVNANGEKGEVVKHRVQITMRSNQSTRALRLKKLKAQVRSEGGTLKVIGRLLPASSTGGSGYQVDSSHERAKVILSAGRP